MYYLNVDECVYALQHVLYSFTISTIFYRSMKAMLAQGSKLLSTPVVSQHDQVMYMVAGLGFLNSQY